MSCRVHATRIQFGSSSACSQLNELTKLINLKRKHAYSVETKTIENNRNSAQLTTSWQQSLLKYRSSRFV